LLTGLLIASEALAFVCAALIFLTVIGLGLTELLLPADGFQLLIAPAVGLAVLALGFQWMTFVVPPYVAALVVFVVFGALTGRVFWRQRMKLLARWPDLLGAGAITLVFFVALIQIDLQRGFFTLGGFPSDNVFIYVQAAQYLVDHAMPPPHHALSLASIGSAYLAGTGTAFPNSVGPIDAATSVLSGWPVYALFDLINALALAIAAGPVWFLLRSGLGASWLAAAAAATLLATSQLMYWVMGNGFQQESLALPIFITGLVTAAHAVRAESARAGVLTGVLVASVIGLYLPIAVLMFVCTVACVLARVVVDRKATWRGVLRPAVGAVGAGISAGAAAIYILLFMGGLAIWINIASVRVPAGGVSRFPLLPYLLGTLPFAHVWELLPQPYGRLERLAFPLLVLASALLVLLLFLGFARAIIRHHAQEAAILGAGLLFVAYEAAVARYPYGFAKSIGYMGSLTSAFVAYGAVGPKSLARPLSGRAVRAAGVASLALVLLASALASRDMVRLWVENPGTPTFPRSYIALSELSRPIPVGASVFVDYPVEDYAGLVKVAAIAYFLPDRQVRVFAGFPSTIKFADQTVRPQACEFDYVISAAAPDGDFSIAYTGTAANLNVYKRQGARCQAR
jgi:hypothetical protein